MITHTNHSVQTQQLIAYLPDCLSANWSLRVLASTHLTTGTQLGGRPLAAHPWPPTTAHTLDIAKASVPVLQSSTTDDCAAAITGTIKQGQCRIGTQGQVQRTAVTPGLPAPGPIMSPPRCREAQSAI